LDSDNPLTMKSWQQTVAVRDYGPTDLVLNHVLVILTTYANESGFCWPTVAQLVRACRLCKRAVLYRLAELERNGWLIINPKAAKDHKGNTYQIAPLEAPESGAPRCT
jgi:hypothetical protein